MSRSTTISAATAGAAIILAFLLNPSPERHRAKIETVISERSPLAQALGVGSIAAFASTYHTLGIASYTTAGEDTLSVGVLGMVFVTQ